MASSFHQRAAAKLIPDAQRIMGETVTYRRANAGDGVEITAVVQVGRGIDFDFGGPMERRNATATVKVEAGDLPSGSPERGDSVEREDGTRWFVEDQDGGDAGWLTLNVVRRVELRGRARGGGA